MTEDVRTETLKEVFKDGTVYGIPISEVSYKQAMKAINFATKVQPWLEENIGEFDKEWAVVPDKQYDSFRIVFATDELEMYFQLAWVQRDHSTSDEE